MLYRKKMDDKKKYLKKPKTYLLNLKLISQVLYLPKNC